MNKVTAVCLQENMAFFYLNVTLLKEISELQITAFPKSDKSKEIKVDMVIINNNNNNVYFLYCAV